MSSLSHFEIFGDEPEKLAGLYSALFGWRIEQAPAFAYWRIQSSDDAAQMIGGLARRPPFELKGWLAYFQVPSVTDAIAIIEAMAAAS